MGQILLKLDTHHASATSLPSFYGFRKFGLSLLKSVPQIIAHGTRRRDGESDLNLSIGAAVIINGVHDIPPIFDEIGENDSRTPYGVSFGWSVSILHGITMAQLPGIGN
jgi:hypothetical protein